MVARDQMLRHHQSCHRLSVQNHRMIHPVVVQRFQLEPQEEVRQIAGEHQFILWGARMSVPISPRQSVLVVVGPMNQLIYRLLKTGENKPAGDSVLCASITTTKAQVKLIVKTV